MAPIEITHALSVQQPWARALLVRGPNRKPLENRGSKAAVSHPPFPVPAGEWLGIHAGKTVHDQADWCLSLCPEAGPPPLWERGVLLGAVHVVGWMRAEEARRRPDLARWVVPLADYIVTRQPDGWCLVTDDAITLSSPIPMRGWLGRFALERPVQI